MLLLVQLVVFKIVVTPPIIALFDIDIPPKDNIDPPKLKSVASTVDNIDKPPLKSTDPIVDDAGVIFKDSIPLINLSG